MTGHWLTYTCKWQTNEGKWWCYHHIEKEEKNHSLSFIAYFIEAFVHVVEFYVDAGNYGSTVSPSSSSSSSSSGK